MDTDKLTQLQALRQAAEHTSQLLKRLQQQTRREEIPPSQGEHYHVRVDITSRYFLKE